VSASQANHRSSKDPSDSNPSKFFCSFFISSSTGSLRLSNSSRSSFWACFKSSVANSSSVCFLVNSSIIAISRRSLSFLEILWKRPAFVLMIFSCSFFSSSISLFMRWITRWLLSLSVRVRLAYSLSISRSWFFCCERLCSSWSMVVSFRCICSRLFLMPLSIC